MYRNQIKKSIFLILIFITISFLFSLEISCIQSATYSDKLRNNFISPNAIKFNISETKAQFDLDDYKFLKNITKNFLFYKQSFLYNEKSICFNGNKNLTPPLISGRYFTEKDMENYQPLAIIGDFLIKDCIDKNGNLYFNIDDGKIII